MWLSQFSCNFPSCHLSSSNIYVNSIKRFSFLFCFMAKLYNVQKYYSSIIILSTFLYIQHKNIVRTSCCSSYLHIQMQEFWQDHCSIQCMIKVLIHIRKLLVTKLSRCTSGIFFKYRRKMITGRIIQLIGNICNRQAFIFKVYFCWIYFQCINVGMWCNTHLLFKLSFKPGGRQTALFCNILDTDIWK